MPEFPCHPRGFGQTGEGRFSGFGPRADLPVLAFRAKRWNSGPSARCGQLIPGGNERPRLPLRRRVRGGFSPPSLKSGPSRTLGGYARDSLAGKSIATFSGVPTLRTRGIERPDHVRSPKIRRESVPGVVFVDTVGMGEIASRIGAWSLSAS